MKYEEFNFTSYLRCWSLLHQYFILVSYSFWTMAYFFTPFLTSKCKPAAWSVTMTEFQNSFDRFWDDCPVTQFWSEVTESALLDCSIPSIGVIGFPTEMIPLWIHAVRFHVKKPGTSVLRIAQKGMRRRKKVLKFSFILHLLTSAFFISKGKKIPFFFHTVSN